MPTRLCGMCDCATVVCVCVCLCGVRYSLRGVVWDVVMCAMFDSELVLCVQRVGTLLVMLLCPLCVLFVLVSHGQVVAL